MCRGISKEIFWLILVCFSVLSARILEPGLVRADGVAKFSPMWCLPSINVVQGSVDQHGNASILHALGNIRGEQVLRLARALPGVLFVRRNADCFVKSGNKYIELEMGFPKLLMEVGNLTFLDDLDGRESFQFFGFGLAYIVEKYFHSNRTGEPDGVIRADHNPCALIPPSRLVDRLERLISHVGSFCSRIGTLLGRSQTALHNSGLIDQDRESKGARDCDNTVKNKLKLPTILFSFLLFVGLSLKSLGWAWDDERSLGIWGFTGCALVCFGFAQVAGYYILRLLLG